MKPEGMCVVEINLNRPNTFYYLHWRPQPAREGGVDIRRHLNAARHTAGDLEWRILADGAWGAPLEIHILFESTSANLDRGLSVLLQSADRYRLCLVQADDAVRHVLRHIRRQDGARQAPPTNNLTTELPDVHFGIFMGERTWAEQMLDALSLEEPAPATRRHPSLTEIARACPDTRDAITEAYRTQSYSLKDIAEFFDMHFSEVSAIINTTLMDNGNRVS